MSLPDKIAKARSGGDPQAVARARAGLAAFAGTAAARGASRPEIAEALATGAAAEQIGRVGLDAARPRGLACAEGCAFCCILNGADGGTISEYEARRLHAALAPLADQPDGRAWHPDACAALDPETRTCRAYDARPMICRSYVSTDAAACESVSQGTPKPGPGTLGPYHTYLAALGLSRAALKGTARVATHSLSRLTAAAAGGADVETALAASRHKPADLDAELKRSKRDSGLAASRR